MAENELLEWLGPQGQNLAMAEGWIEEHGDGWVVAVRCVNRAGETRVQTSKAFKTRVEAEATLAGYAEFQRAEDAVKTVEKITAPAPVASRPNVVLPTEADERTNGMYRLFVHLLDQQPEIVRTRVLRLCVYGFARKDAGARKLATFDKAYFAVMPSEPPSSQQLGEQKK